MVESEDFYWENGLMVMTERFHRKRGFCCGNACRHCPYGHAAVPDHVHQTRRDRSASFPPVASIERRPRG